MRYRNIIFDFDGTLVDTAALIIETMHRTIDALNLPNKSDEECRSMIGYRLEEIPSILWPGIPQLSERYVTTYRNIFNFIKNSFKVRLYPHVHETLTELSKVGIKMAIASSRSKASVQEYCSELLINEYFQSIVGGEDVKNGKPAPDPVNLILDSQGWDKKETLVVGDMNVDILMGKKAGTSTCGITYGNGSPTELKEARANYIISDFSQLIGILEPIAPEIIDYVEREIIPRYNAFDRAHRENHVRMVIEQSLKLAELVPSMNPDMVYIIAAFHDLGLVNGRENHHKDSRKILEADEFVKSHFTPDQIHIMGEAVEDHRASNSQKPRSEYGLIVAEADRFIDPETIIRRTIQYGLANYPQLDKAGHYKRTVEHLNNKYGPEGYLKVWIPWSDNAQNLKKLHIMLTDKPRLDKIFNRIFEEENARS